MHNFQCFGKKNNLPLLAFKSMYKCKDQQGHIYSCDYGAHCKFSRADKVSVHQKTWRDGTSLVCIIMDKQHLNIL